MKSGQFSNLLDTMAHTLCSLSYPTPHPEKGPMYSPYFITKTFLTLKHCFPHALIRVLSLENLTLKKNNTEENQDSISNTL